MKATLLLALAGVLLFTACRTMPDPAARLEWKLVEPGHWNQHVVQPRCPGCPPQTNAWYSQPLYGWVRVQ